MSASQLATVIYSIPLKQSSLVNFYGSSLMQEFYIICMKVICMHIIYT